MEIGNLLYTYELNLVVNCIKMGSASFHCLYFV